MSFDWHEYFSLAQDLVGRTAPPYSREAKQRAAISRAYYAAFILARNYLRDKERVEIPTDAGAHRLVIDRFKSKNNARRNQISNNLNLLRKLRNLADYDDNLFDASDKTRDALRLAGQIISELSNL